MSNSEEFFTPSSTPLPERKVKSQANYDEDKETDDIGNFQAVKHIKKLNTRKTVKKLSDDTDDTDDENIKKRKDALTPIKPQDPDKGHKRKKIDRPANRKLSFDDTEEVSDGELSDFSKKIFGKRQSVGVASLMSPQIRLTKLSDQDLKEMENLQEEHSEKGQQPKVLPKRTRRTPQALKSPFLRTDKIEKKQKRKKKTK